VDQALPGTRTAANLVGLAPEDLTRGQVVTTPGWLKPSLAVDVRLRALDSLRRPLRHNLSVTFHCFSSETPAKLRLLEDDEALPGDEVWAQIRLLRPAAVLKGDRFVIRDANDTIGGGIVVETQAKRHPRRRESVIGGLERQQGGSPAEALYAAIASGEPVEISSAISRTDLSTEAAAQALTELQADGRLILLSEAAGALAYTRPTFDRLATRARSAVETFLKQRPLRRGLGKEELRNRLSLEQRTFGPVLDALVREGVLVDAGRVASVPGWAASLSPAQAKAAEAYLAVLKAAPYAPPTDSAPEEDLLAYLIESGDVVDLGGGIVFAAEAYREMVDAVVARLSEKGTITLAEVRDLFGNSRRYAQALIEYLDRERITLRRGDERVLGPNAGRG
jgi:selenocysteine-specific elongation factor